MSLKEVCPLFRCFLGNISGTTRQQKNYGQTYLAVITSNAFENSRLLGYAYQQIK